MHKTNESENTSAKAENEIFVCHEESEFYSLCIERMVFEGLSSKALIEFGSGDGTPVLDALGRSAYSGKIVGYEINDAAAEIATTNIALAGEERYRVVNRCFYTACRLVEDETCLVANPPYVPAPDAESLWLPHIWGGPDGGQVLCRLLDQGLPSVLLLVPAISNPEGVIDHARSQGYQVHKYLITALPFGYYTSQPEVQEWLEAMRRNGQAYFFDGHYLLAGVLFRREPPSIEGLDRSLLRLLTGSELS